MVILQDSVLAFRRLEAARREIGQYLPKDFNLEKELEEARAERYEVGSGVPAVLPE